MMKKIIIIIIINGHKRVKEDVLDMYGWSRGRLGMVWENYKCAHIHIYMRLLSLGLYRVRDSIFFLVTNFLFNRWRSFHYTNWLGVVFTMRTACQQKKSEHLWVRNL